MKTHSLPDDTTVKEGAANLQLGVETVGGRLSLTSERLVFKSHVFNIHAGATIIPLAQISRTTPCWTKLLNLIPIAPRSLAVSTKAGKEYRFMLLRRHDWKHAIDAQKERVAR